MLDPTTFVPTRERGMGRQRDVPFPPFLSLRDRWKMAQVFRGEDVFREMEETAPLLRCCPSVSLLRCTRVNWRASVEFPELENTRSFQLKGNKDGNFEYWQKFPRFSLTPVYIRVCVCLYTWIYLPIQINALYPVKRDGRVKSDWTIVWDLMYIYVVILSVLFNSSMRVKNVEETFRLRGSILSNFLIYTSTRIEVIFSSYL